MGRAMDADPAPRRWTAVSADGRAVAIEVTRCGRGECGGYCARIGGWEGPCKGDVETALHEGIGVSGMRVVELVPEGAPTRSDLVAALRALREALPQCTRWIAHDDPALDAQCGERATVFHDDDRYCATHARGAGPESQPLTTALEAADRLLERVT